MWLFFGYIFGHLSFLGRLSFCPKAWDGLLLVPSCGSQGLAVVLAGHIQELLPREMWDWQVLLFWGQALPEPFSTRPPAWGTF